MKYLLWFDAALAAIGGVMTISMGFVVLVFGLFINDSPILRNGIGGVSVITACFAVLFALALAATIGMRRSRGWHWPLQAVILLSLPLMWRVIVMQLRAA